MKNALNNQVGMLGDMFLWLVTNLKQGVIYFIKQALPPNISAGSVIPKKVKVYERQSFLPNMLFKIVIKKPKKSWTAKPAKNHPKYVSDSVS